MEDVVTIQSQDITPFNYALHRISTHRPWSFSRHRHQGVFEFYYLFEGELTHHFDDQEIVMKEGDLLSIKETDYHSLTGRGFDFYNLILPLEYWDNLMDSLHLRELFEAKKIEGRLYTHFLRDEGSRILNDLEQLFLYQKSEYGDILLSRFLLSLAAELLGPPDYEEKKDQVLPLWMKTLMLEVDGRMGDQLTVKDMSDLSGKSPEHLSRSFRRFLDTTPSSWLNRQKMERAALMLEHSNTAVLDIALSLGFDNLGYFYRLFRKHFGVPPVVYRKENAIYQGF
ncbi:MULTISPECIES: AraC family transcriptional regulator [unclassified Oceanispirochaeta]|nr:MULTISPECIES: helix-turn-helix domain-containing protein [unclassified Oceanispirochaeta]MBF9018141.1 AraC family transcriptional regulator [Oceanispirochaeta sp. M2]NPD74605.1 AraC family transcriptional regulator [Oceanispirochaeta sp. M1]